MKHKIVLFQKIEIDFQSKIMNIARSANATINLLKKIKWNTEFKKSIKLWPLSVTLTLEVVVQVLCMTYRLSIVATFYQVFSKSLELWRSYRWDTKYTL
jgi:hypothetical protein